MKLSQTLRKHKQQHHQRHNVGVKYFSSSILLHIKNSTVALQKFAIFQMQIFKGSGWRGKTTHEEVRSEATKREMK